MNAGIVILDFQPQSIRRAECLIFIVKNQLKSARTELLLFGWNIHIEEYMNLPYDRIVVFNSPYCSMQNYLPEPLLDALSGIMQTSHYDVLIFPDGDLENELCARSSFRFGTQALLGVESFNFSERCFVVKKPVYSYNLKADFEVKCQPVMFSLLNSQVMHSVTPLTTKPKIEYIPMESFEQGRSGCLHIETNQEKDIFETARLIIVGGRGVGSKIGIAKLQLLADMIHGALGGTRPTVLDCWLDSNRLVGVSGRIISPELCITFGVSGSMPLVAGIEKSRLIISVNTDESATIFKHSDVGIVHDCSEIVDFLIQEISNHNKD